MRDPEHPYSLEELKVVTEEAVYVRRDDDGTEYVRVVFTPTVPHCSLSTLIGLCIRHKLSAEMPGAKIEVFVKPGSHMTADESEWLRLCAPPSPPCALTLLPRARQSQSRSTTRSA